ncbi:hypothetical protein [Acinetobacter silvestris]|uniref:DUF1440 domain-containing protein n=1 Tax=Acinetobacter silvestris TaxID=1977882 RepID=A0A1Y3CK52_9GAMM|nr:hypothetical protein [Acinetobacter silvestris]OTG67499.1 hypothetical protein B9T28_02420 [Acinetobacter silvestris]
MITTHDSTWTISSRKNIVAVLVTSQIAGLIMAVVVMLVFTLFLGKGPLYPVQVIGSTIFGESALHGFNLAAFIAGLLLHQSVALVWGGVFALAANTLKVTTVQASIGLGLIVAIFSMIDSYVFVPAVMNALHGVDIWHREVPMFWNWAAHMVFGLSFGLYPKLKAMLTSVN